MKTFPISDISIKNAIINSVVNENEKNNMFINNTNITNIELNEDKLQEKYNFLLTINPCYKCSIADLKANFKQSFVRYLRYVVGKKYNISPNPFKFSLFLCNSDNIFKYNHIHMIINDEITIEQMIVLQGILFLFLSEECYKNVDIHSETIYDKTKLYQYIMTKGARSGDCTPKLKFSNDYILYDENTLK